MESGKKSAPDPDAQERILVIKLSALGDFIQALGPMAAIRRRHPGAQITLLTTPPFAGFGKACGYFNEVWTDERPRWHDLRGWLALRGRLNGGKFGRVYDLQNNDRTAFYLKLMTPKPEWVGAAPGASHRNTSTDRTAGHAFDGHLQTLKLAGIDDVRIDDLRWIEADLSRFALKAPYILLVPGSAPTHPQKRWPAEHYAALAERLAEQGFQPVLLGTKAETEVTGKIAAACPSALDLTGQTSLFDIAALGRGAAAAVGNDTGPMHLIAATGIPCLSLFSGHTNPVRHAPKGENVTVLREAALAALPPDTVFRALEPALARQAFEGGIIGGIAPLPSGSSGQ